MYITKCVLSNGFSVLSVMIFVLSNGFSVLSRCPALETKIITANLEHFADN